jgi:hypothetical protein
MNNHELKVCALSDPVLKSSFLGAFPSNKIPPYAQTGHCFILNTDPANQPGKHWVAVLYTDDQNTEFFCPYGVKSSTYCPAWTKHFLSRAPYLHQNVRMVQDIMSNVCGEHSLMFLHLRLSGVPFKDIITKVYKQNDFCWNDQLCVNFISHITKVDLKEELSVPVQICKPMHVNLM